MRIHQLSALLCCILPVTMLSKQPSMLYVCALLGDFTLFPLLSHTSPLPCTECQAFTNKGQLVSPYLGENLTLSCNTSHSSTPVWWTKSSSPGAMVLHRGADLQFAPVLYEQDSPYYCFARDPDYNCTQWLRFVLEVQYDWGRHLFL